MQDKSNNNKKSGCSSFQSCCKQHSAQIIVFIMGIAQVVQALVLWVDCVFTVCTCGSEVFKYLWILEEKQSHLNIPLSNQCFLSC